MIPVQLGRKRLHAHSAVYIWDEMRRKKVNIDKVNHVTEAYDVNTHIQQELQPEPWLKELRLDIDEERISTPGSSIMIT